MPSSSNLDDAVSARKVAEAFGIKALTVDLTPVSDVLFSMLPNGVAIAAVVPLVVEEADQHTRQKLAKANVHPRLRMTTVYYVANLVKGIVVGTGNKSEAMVGYFTKYGDGGVDLLPIIDLYKHEVRAVARHIGVPQSVIDRPPSAGLWQGQTDEDEIGLTYEVLDDALSAIESGDTSCIEPATLQRIKDMNFDSEHKRKPIPVFRRSAP
jgi:NAD+ synthase